MVPTVCNCFNLHPVTLPPPLPFLHSHNLASSSSGLSPAPGANSLDPATALTLFPSPAITPPYPLKSHSPSRPEISLQGWDAPPANPLAHRPQSRPDSSASQLQLGTGYRTSLRLYFLLRKMRSTLTHRASEVQGAHGPPPHRALLRLKLNVLRSVSVLWTLHVVGSSLLAPPSLMKLKFFNLNQPISGHLSSP